MSKICSITGAKPSQGSIIHRRGLAKKKGKEMGAVAAVGGEKFMRQTSSRSFNNLDDYAVYLHVTHAGTAGYDQALAAAMAVYPELEAGYQPAIQNAYKRAQQGR